jgi:site-specific DNA-methyltransferase (adenine-specific)
MADDVRVIHGDCLAVLPTLDAGSIDAIVTDPPWGIGYRSGHNSSRRGGWARWVKDENFAPIAGDDAPFDPSPWLGFPRVALIGANCFAGRLPDSRGWVVWDKLDGLAPASGSDCELIWTNADKPARLFRHLWRGLIRKGPENVVNGAKLHPHQKPVALMQFLLDYLEVPAGGLVLDPFAGSGSTLVACIKSGRRAVGIEIDERYIPIINRRLRDAATPFFAGLCHP